MRRRKFQAMRTKVFRDTKSLSKYAKRFQKEYWFPHTLYRDDPKWMWELGDVYDPSFADLKKHYIEDFDEDHIEWLYYERFPRYITFKTWHPPRYKTYKRD